jgi:hypothetical protein
LERKKSPGKEVQNKYREEIDRPEVEQIQPLGEKKKRKFIRTDGTHGVAKRTREGKKAWETTS